jgi:hypothetical protein
MGYSPASECQGACSWLSQCSPISRSPSEVNDLLSVDLALTMTALRQYPKVYWIWNHRRWCLQNVPDGPDEDHDGWRKANWAKELYVVEKMLEADARNCAALYCLVFGEQLTEPQFTHGTIGATYSHRWSCRARLLKSSHTQLARLSLTSPTSVLGISAQKFIHLYGSKA